MGTMKYDFKSEFTIYKFTYKVYMQQNVRRIGVCVYIYIYMHKKELYIKVVTNVIWLIIDLYHF
jgi:hypothetical protein